MSKKKKLRTVRLNLNPEEVKEIKYLAAYVKMTMGSFITLCLKKYIKDTDTQVENKAFLVYSNKELRALRRLKGRIICKDHNGEEIQN